MSGLCLHLCVLCLTSEVVFCAILIIASFEGFFALIQWFQWFCFLFLCVCVCACKFCASYQTNSNFLFQFLEVFHYPFLVTMYLISNLLLFIILVL